ncbi:MAG: hypothetical protein WDN04_18060 [Rhodospirillales bacterium]
MNYWLVLAACVWPALASAAPVEMAYYSDGTSFHSLKAEAGTLGIVAADLFDVDINGRVSGRVPAKVSSVATANALPCWPRFPTGPATTSRETSRSRC